MIGIGITENVYITGAALDDKSILEISFKEKTEQSFNPYDVIAADGVVVEGSDSISIRIFPPLPPKEGNDRTEEKNIELIVGDINRTKGIILHLLRGYYTQEQLKGKLDPFRGVPVDKTNFKQQILQKAILEQIHRNMATDFQNMMRDFIGKDDQLFRLLLVRQSKDKHFATFRGRYLEENPFWESMDVPKDQSKVKFNKYELDNGLDSAAPTARDSSADEKGKGSTPAPLTAQNVFGS